MHQNKRIIMWLLQYFGEGNDNVKITIDALEKQIPKKVVCEHIPKTSFTKEVWHYLCPSCRSIISFSGSSHCSNCGQKLDWSVIE